MRGTPPRPRQEAPPPALSLWERCPAPIQEKRNMRGAPRAPGRRLRPPHSRFLRGCQSFEPLDKRARHGYTLTKSKRVHFWSNLWNNHG